MSGRTRTAFTLAELLAVITILVLIVGLAVPAFRSLLYSSNQALAENKLRMGLGTAREAALLSAGGGDTAAVFTLDAGGRVTITPYVQVAVLTDVNADNELVQRDVFVPFTRFSPVQMPGGWMVRGYAVAYAVSRDWYEKTYGEDADIDYRAQGNWLAPESGYYDEFSTDDGADRQTFMVRFRAGTGLVDTGATGEALIVSPRPSSLDRAGEDWLDPNEAADLGRWVARVLARPPNLEPPSWEILGDRSGDTILAKPVTLLAIADESRVASAVEVRRDRQTGSLYRDPRNNNGEPEFVEDLDPDRVNQWIEGRLERGGRAVDSDAMLFAIDRYGGEVYAFEGQE